MAELIRLPAGAELSAEQLRRLAEAGRRGRLTAFPTDTVYGLGASALSADGVEAIYRAKRRPRQKALPLLVAGAEAARRWVQWTAQAEALAARFWPGALTLVLRAGPDGRTLPCAQGPTLAVRAPRHPVAQALVRASQSPWASTSANLSGRPPAADGAEALRIFGEALAFAIDAGPAAGLQSSVVDASQAPVRVLREGAIPAAQLLRAVAEGAGPTKYLFVCTGNTCRSVMAQFLLRKLARERGLEASARSAGVAAERHFQVPPGVRSALAAEGIRELEHVPQLVGRDLLEWADQVLVMEKLHRELILDRFPEFGGKVRTLAAGDIADPIGRPDDVYAACCREIKKNLEAFLDEHAQIARS
ncbi:MAG: L-threonylcarbamoyladenylate synthase [Elusimicrobia bacterium]|nr:L-threonylcarbamoyladenylate synthase [Elusimicrobiota bacterium]